MSVSPKVVNGFTRADAPVKQRVIAASYGEPGSGKTSFWLSAPGPIFVQSFDRGLEGVIEKYQDDKEIQVAEYDWSPTEDLDQQEAIDLREKFTAEFEYAIKHARTVVWDSETYIWELFRYAEFGAPNDSPRNYPALNQRYRRLVNAPKALDINFGLIQGMKAEWAAKVNKKTGAQGAAATGERIRAGFGELEGLVHVNIEHTRVDGAFALTVGKSRGPGSADVQDKTFSNVGFSELAQLIFPDSSEEDWQ